jgi:hypothetical protein
MESLSVYHYQTHTPTFQTNRLQVNIEKIILRYRERHEERDGRRETDEVRDNHENWDQTYHTLSVVRLLTERETTLYHIMNKRHHIVSYIYRYMFIHSER